MVIDNIYIELEKKLYMAKMKNKHKIEVNVKKDTEITKKANLLEEHLSSINIL